MVVSCPACFVGNDPGPWRGSRRTVRKNALGASGLEKNNEKGRGEECLAESPRSETRAGSRLCGKRDTALQFTSLDPGNQRGSNGEWKRICPQKKNEVGANDAKKKGTAENNQGRSDKKGVRKAVSERNASYKS